jgi:hypothetical protein
MPLNLVAQYNWTPSVSLVDNTSWCVSNNCYTSIGGSVNILSAGFDGTVYGLNAARTLYRWTQANGWVEAPSGLQTAGGQKLNAITVASATQMAVIANSTNVYLLNSAGTEWTGPLATGSCTQISMAVDGTLACVGDPLGRIWVWNSSANAWDALGSNSGFVAVSGH